MLQHPLQRFAVSALNRHQQAANPALARRLVGLAAFQQPAAHHRRQGQRDRQRNANRHRQGNGEFAQQPSRQAAHQQQRQEHCHQRQAHRQHGKTDFPAPLQRRLQRLHAGFQMAGNIFQHHDGVIDHEAGSDSQRHQRQVVKAEAAQVHGGKGADQRNRNRHRRDQRRAPRAEEEEDHEDHQRHRDDQRLLHFLQRGADGRRAVLGDLQIDRGRDGALQLRQAGANAVHRLDDIGFRQLADHQQNRRFGVSHPGVAHVLHRIGDVGDVAEAHRRSVVVVHDQRLVFGRGFQLVVGRHLPAVGGIFQRPLRFTYVGVADGGAHRVQRYALVKQRLRVEVDAHRGQRTAADVHVADAVNLGNGLRQLGRGEVVQFTLGPGIRGEGEDHDRRV